MQAALLAEFVEAAREEREAWQVLSDCDQATSDCTEAFARWKRASEVAQRVAQRWQDAIASRRAWPIREGDPDGPP